MSDFTHALAFVKICGVTSPEDATVVADAGASALGVILTSSLRRVDVDQARRITDRVAGRLVRFAVVDSRDRFSLDAVLSGVGVDVVQVHGDLPAELLEALRAQDLGVVKALSVDTAEFENFDETVVDALLIDGPVPGSGAPHSFAALGHRRFSRPVIAAGGLTPHNVTGAIGGYDVWGVDVSSGVESTPGVKDPLRVVEFVDVARRSFEGRVTT
jgi:phosphoribosylanthranilate isomerase